MSDNVTVTTTTTGDKKNTTITDSGNLGNGFRFPYLLAPNSNVVKDVTNSAYGLYITKISNDNKYYFHGSWSNAVAINNAKLVGSGYGSPKYDKIRRLKSGTTLANCVGWAHGRVIEIWNTAKEYGIVKYESGSYVLPQKGNQVIKCGREPNNYSVPAGDAYTFYNNWPTSDGWYKSSKSQDDQRPLPGAIICWASTSGKKGHVAVVEAVYNYGEENEYIVISESGYSTWGAENIVSTRVIHRSSKINGAVYGYGSSYKFSGFLFSPVCQLIDGYYASGQANYSIADVDLLWADTEKYNTISQALAAAGKKVIKDIVVGENVKITWFGSSTKDETQSKINLMDAQGIVISVDNSCEYPYAVSITGDGVISGYFKRDALKAINIEE